MNFREKTAVHRYLRNVWRSTAAPRKLKKIVKKELECEIGDYAVERRKKADVTYTGLVFEFGDPQNIADEILSFFCDPSECAAMYRKSRKWLIFGGIVSAILAAVVAFIIYAYAVTPRGHMVVYGPCNVYSYECGKEYEGHFDERYPITFNGGENAPDGKPAAYK